MAEFQVKVEYSGSSRHEEQKWISFMIPLSDISSGQYSFCSLVNDITRKCSSLSFLDTHSIRLRYLDDEDNWINLNFDDERGFADLWQSARNIPEREFKRIKLRAGVLGSPTVLSSKQSKDHELQESLFTSTRARCLPTTSVTKPAVPLPTASDRPSAPSQFANAVDNPVDRMLSQKKDKIKKAAKELDGAEIQKQNFERELSKATRVNSGTLSICGKCHMKLGHTRRNCDGEECTSVFLCGILDKHPEEKSMRRNLSQQVTKCQSKLSSLENEYDIKLKSYKSVEDSFAKKIENDIVASDPGKYIVNGVKNWSLLNKHVALLEKKCNGRLPPKSIVTQLLQQAVREHERIPTQTQGSRSCVNPKKRILENEFSIRFPQRQSNSAPTTTSTSTTSTFYDAYDDFQMAIRLQDEFNREFKADGQCSPPEIGMHIPGNGWIPPSNVSESKETQEDEAAKALMSLKSDYTCTSL